MLVAAMKPCRCGHATEPGICRHGQNARCASDYQVRVSGPLIDRIDLHVEVPAVTAAESRREVGERVARASALQVERYAGAGARHIRCNAAADGPLRDATNAMRLSARGYHRVPRVAHTLADLDRAAAVSRVHLAEALPYRALANEMRRAA
jgi:magnesium chelatase family protein